MLVAMPNCCGFCSPRGVIVFDPFWPYVEKMSIPSTRELTQLLQQWSDGEEAASEKLMLLLYEELRQMAHRHMRQERPDHTLQTTALINEAYLRLINWKNVRWQNRAHFFAVCAQLMRRILVDFARSRKYLKRGAGIHVQPLGDVPDVSCRRATEIIALDDALQRLAKIDPRKSRIVELRFFGGLTVDETAALLKVTSRTILRDWDLAKAFLHRELSVEKMNLKQHPAKNSQS
jgi:RNA polymerase sigma factor (TIGR02999 family)